MKDKYKAIEKISSGEIICDNPECDFKFTGVEDKVLGEFVDMPCPECGQNLLTQEDYNHNRALLKMVRVVNVIMFPYMFLKRLFKRNIEYTTTGYHHHAGKTTIIKEDEKTEQTRT